MPKMAMSSSEIPRVRYRTGIGGCSSNVNNSTSPRSTSMTLNTNNNLHAPSNDTRGSQLPIIPSDIYNTMASPKMHGRQMKRHEDFVHSSKYNAVLILSLVVLTICIMGVFIVSESTTKSGYDSAVGRYGTLIQKHHGKKIRWEKDRSQRRKNQVMEVYQPIRKTLDFSSKDKQYNGEARPHIRHSEIHRLENFEESNNDMKYDDDDDLNSIVTLHIPSSAIELPSREVDMGTWGYRKKPRVLHCDFKTLENQLSDNNYENEATLVAVHKIYAHENQHIPPSQREIASYSNDLDNLKRIREVKKNSKKYRIHEREPLDTDTCTAKYQWQKGAFPNCNNLHELELGKLISMHGRAMRKRLNIKEGDGDEQLKYWAHGYWRDIWLISKVLTSSSPSFKEVEEITVFKTLRFNHDFTDRNYDRHRKDALASERLSKSPYVMDIYAYCSNSAIFEYGDGGDVDSRLWPYDEEEKKHYIAELTPLDMIDLAFQVARAIAAIHDVEEDGIASIAHTDITPTQFIYTEGRYKVNDFNRCRFMRVNTTDNSPCGFVVGANPGKFRAPEEYAFETENEMVDVYSMGNIFYSIISGNMPFENEKEKDAQQKVKNGDRPQIPQEVLKNDDVAIQTLISLIKSCWQRDPKNRPSASKVRDELKQVIDSMTTTNVMMHS